MIRRVELQDAKAITTIYNEYVRHSVATFETGTFERGGYA